ncbi:MAG TPA: hypothetical protein VGM67_02615 [Gemmatimonadaceae bacterium]
MSAPKLDTRNLLLSRRLEKVEHSPFTYFMIDDYLPAPVFRQLMDEFPGADYMSGETHGNKRYFSPDASPDTYARFRNAHPLWAQLADFFDSEEFMKDINGVFRRDLLRSRGASGLRPWQRADRSQGIRRLPVFQPVKLSVEFSSLGAGCFVPPHTDRGGKLISLMLYFAPPDWKAEYGGGTDFYVPADRNDEALKDNWANREVRFDQMSTFATSAFVPNRLAGFLKSKVSYHGVNALACPPGVFRKSLNININATKAV